MKWSTSRLVQPAHVASVDGSLNMRLESKEGHVFEMRIVGYQFPHLETADYDSNWLFIAGEVVHPKGTWQFSDPCLLTYEVARLASWIDSIAERPPLSTTCDFIEPNLPGDHPVLGVYFELEARPAWASRQAADGELWVEFPLNDLDLRLIARELRSALSAYPQRAPK
jgi:hypothetical protein